MLFLCSPLSLPFAVKAARALQIKAVERLFAVKRGLTRL